MEHRLVGNSQHNGTKPHVEREIRSAFRFPQSFVGSPRGAQIGRIGRAGKLAVQSERYLKIRSRPDSSYNARSPALPRPLLRVAPCAYRNSASCQKKISRPTDQSTFNKLKRIAATVRDDEDKYTSGIDPADKPDMSYADLAKLSHIKRLKLAWHRTAIKKLLETFYSCNEFIKRRVRIIAARTVLR